MKEKEKRFLFFPISAHSEFYRNYEGNGNSSGDMTTILADTQQGWLCLYHPNYGTITQDFPFSTNTSGNNLNVFGMKDSISLVQTVPTGHDSLELYPYMSTCGDCLFNAAANALLLTTDYPLQPVDNMLDLVNKNLGTLNKDECSSWYTAQSVLIQRFTLSYFHKLRATIAN